MSLPELAFPADIDQRIIRNVRTACQLRAALQLQSRVRADDNAADQISARRNGHDAAAVRRAEIKRRLERRRVLGCAVALRAQVTDIDGKRTCHLARRHRAAAGGNRQNEGETKQSLKQSGCVHVHFNRL